MNGFLGSSQPVGWNFPTFGMKNATLPPSDFVSKIIEPPIKRNQGVFCCSAFTGEGGICREAPKNADFPSSQFRGSFLSSNLELFLVWAIVLCGVDVSFLCSWELKQINFWTIENWLHHFKLRHFITSNRWYLSHYAWCHRGFARWHLFNHHFIIHTLKLWMAKILHHHIKPPGIIVYCIYMRVGGFNPCKK